MTNTKRELSKRLDREAKELSRWWKVTTVYLHPEAKQFNPCGAMPIQELDSLVDRVRSSGGTRQ